MKFKLTFPTKLATVFKEKNPRLEMKILLVGGLGFIGKRFIRKFAKIHEITLLVKKESYHNLDKIIDLTGVNLEFGQVEESQIIDIIKKCEPEVVIHLAALTGLEKCQGNPEKAFSVNVFGTYNIIKSCIDTNAKLIFLSSREVYGETLGESSREDDLLIPNNIYGLTKMIGENMIKVLNQKFNFDYTVLRLTNVYGPEGNQYGAQKIIQDAIKEHKVRILGGSQQLNFVYVDDVVDLINDILKGKKFSNQTFNVGSEDTLTIKEFAEKVFNSLEIDGEFEYLPMRKTETSDFNPNLEKTKSMLGNFLKTPLSFGIKQTIKWYSDGN